MTGPGPADSSIDSRLRGVNPANGQFETFQATHARGRNIWGTCDQNQPFQTDFGSGPVAVTIATYDQETTTNEVTAWRHVDPNGQVVNQMKVMMALWYWLQDGAPTNMGALGGTTNRVPLYVQLAKQLRNWPSGYPGAMPGEPSAAYPSWPPQSPTPLEQLGNINISKVVLEDVRTHPPVTKYGAPQHVDHVHAAWPESEAPLVESPSRYLPNVGLGDWPPKDAVLTPDPAMTHITATWSEPEDTAPEPMTDRQLLMHIARRLTELGILQ